MISTKPYVVAALEKAAREEFSTFDRSHVKCDDQAVRYGALVPRIAFMAGLDGVTVRYHLKRLERDGKVLADQSRPGGMARWWPVGLFEKIQNEQKGGAA